MRVTTAASLIEPSLSLSGRPEAVESQYHWYVAQFERELVLEGQRLGIERAKQAGKYNGRKPTGMAKADEVKALVAQGVAKAEIARRLGIGRASVYRALR